MSDSHEHAIIQGANALHRYVMIAAVVYTLTLLATGYWGLFISRVVGITGGSGIGWTLLTGVVFALSFSLCTKKLAIEHFFATQQKLNIDLVSVRERVFGADYGPEGFDYIEQQSFTMRAFVSGLIMVALMLCVGRITQHWGWMLDMVASWVMVFVATMVYVSKPHDVAEKAIEMHEQVIVNIRALNTENRAICEAEYEEKQAKKAAKKELKRVQKERDRSRRLGIS